MKKYEPNDFIGMGSGNLVVTGGKRIGGNLYLDCKCDCGNTISVRHNNFLGKKQTSCGCKTSRSIKHLIIDNSQVYKFGVKTSRNTSGYVGVDYQKKSKKYRARINLKRRTFELGLFPTAKEAYNMRQKVIDILSYYDEQLKSSEGTK